MVIWAFIRKLHSLWLISGIKISFLSPGNHISKIMAEIQHQGWCFHWFLAGKTQKNPTDNREESVATAILLRLFCPSPYSLIQAKQFSSLICPLPFYCIWMKGTVADLTTKEIQGWRFLWKHSLRTGRSFGAWLFGVFLLFLFFKFCGKKFSS